MKTISKSDINYFLAEQNGWKLIDDAIEKTFTLQYHQHHVLVYLAF